VSGHNTFISKTLHLLHHLCTKRKGHFSYQPLNCLHCPSATLRDRVAEVFIVNCLLLIVTWGDRLVGGLSSIAPALAQRTIDLIIGKTCNAENIAKEGKLS